MPSDYASSVQAVKIRATKLAADGKPLAGSDNAYYTNAFTRVGFTPEYEEGEEIQERAADGSICIYYKMPDVLKRVNLEIAICQPEPEMYEILAGGTLLMEATENVGWASPSVGEIATPNGISVEVWSRAIVGGKMASVNPYWYWVFPFVNLRPSGERALENGVMANVFEGNGQENAAWGDGPDGSWTFATDSAYQYARVAAVPAGPNGYFVVPAQT